MRLDDVSLLGKKILLGFFVAVVPLVILLGLLTLGRHLLGSPSKRSSTGYSLLHVSKELV